MKLKIAESLKNGEKFQIIPINRLVDLKSGINRFKDDAPINGFQKWIIDNLYDFNVPDVKFSIKSIILVAVPHPLYADVELIYNGNKYDILSVVMSDFNSTNNSIKKILTGSGFNYKIAENIPLKRLAAQCGLARYGRNNICYVDGLGSLFSFVAYYSDIEPEEDSWQEITVAKECKNCFICQKSCPTGAIKEGHFLIDTDRCLSFWNESSTPFPSWIPKTAHHSIYDCIKCQIACPMNRGLEKRDNKKIYFSEEQTRILLSGTGDYSKSKDLEKKVDYLGLNQWPDGIPKNLELFFNINNRVKSPL